MMENGDVDGAVASTSSGGQADILPMEDDNDANQSEELIDGEFMRCTDDNEDMQEVLREQDRFLPIANVSRIMKRVIPDTGKLAKDAKECCQECVSEFISFLTSEASERCASEKRKTINGEDILYSMQALGFDNYVEPLKLFLSKYREASKGTQPISSGSANMTNHADYNQSLPEVPNEPEKRPDYVTQSVNMLVQQINDTVGGCAAPAQDGSSGTRMAAASTILTPGSTIQLQDANGMPVIAYVTGLPGTDQGGMPQIASIPTAGATFQIAGAGSTSAAAPTFLSATVLSSGSADKMNGSVSKHG